MLDYRLACQELDGNWSVQTFQSVSDPDAIAYVLDIRTSARIELFQGDRWLATFDGEADVDDAESRRADGNVARRIAQSETETKSVIETEIAYFRRRAVEERERVRGANMAATAAHLRMAEYYMSLARAVEAEQRRRQFYDVNVHRPAPSSAPGSAHALVEREQAGCCEAASS